MLCNFSIVHPQPLLQMMVVVVVVCQKLSCASVGFSLGLRYFWERRRVRHHDVLQPVNEKVASITGYSQSRFPCLKALGILCGSLHTSLFNQYIIYY